jgi:hypothetical protein
MKNNSFEESYRVIRDLEENDMNLVESLFHYSIAAIRDHDQESHILAKEYKKGSLDPTKINSRFEKQQQLRKRIEAMQKRKRDPMI